jgi:DNA-directed RNA polymerase specialized sigma24 family protein
MLSLHGRFRKGVTRQAALTLVEAEAQDLIVEIGGQLWRRDGEEFAMSDHLEYLMGDIEDPAGDVADQAMANIEAEKARELVQALPDDERHLITMRFGLDDAPVQTLREVARARDQSLHSVKALEQKALRHLYESWHAPLAA